MASKGQLRLRSSQCQTLRNMVEDGCASDIIPLPNVDGKTMEKVMEYYKKHAEEEATEEELKKFDEEFIKVDVEFLHDLLLASNYLVEEKMLLDLLSQKVASMIRGKSPEKIWKILNIKNDFTWKEEKRIRRKYAWAIEEEVFVEESKNRKYVTCSILLALFTCLLEFYLRYFTKYGIINYIEPLFLSGNRTIIVGFGIYVSFVYLVRWH